MKKGEKLRGWRWLQPAPFGEADGCPEPASRGEAALDLLLHQVECKVNPRGLTSRVLTSSDKQQLLANGRSYPDLIMEKVDIGITTGLQRDDLQAGKGVCMTDLHVEYIQ